RGGDARLGARRQRFRVSAKAVHADALAREREPGAGRDARPGNGAGRSNPMSTFAARFGLTEVADRRWRAAATGWASMLYGALSLAGARQQWSNVFADGNGRWGWAPISIAISLGLCGLMVALESRQWASWARVAGALALGWTLGAAAQEIAAASGPWPGRVAPALVLAAVVAIAGLLPS